ncbi:MAG TPA: hypothetical protein VFN10_11805, partial [Thermoanaerobaculia bacterium]|nr:hypothetical protein [Thermoanaerobaculia bacterium]
MKKVHRVLWILIVIASALAAPLMADKVLIYGPTVTGGMSSIEAQTAVSLGFTVDLITTPAAWLALTPADFQSYRAIIVGDPTCTEGTPAVLAPVEANANVWGPLVNGNVIIIGTDPALHSSLGNAAGTAVSQRAVAYAAAQPGKLGAYISLSCYYASAPSGTPVPLLNNAFGPNFLVRSSSGFNSVHMTATSSALVNPLPAPLNTVPPLSDSLLSNWSASTHEIFESWPLNFVVLAIAVTGSSYTAPDGTVGTPYILARGDVSVLSDISLTPASATNDIGTSHTFTASITPPLPGVVVTFKVISGPNAGLTFTALTDASGKASFTYASTAAGTDVIQAQFVNASGKTQTSNLARKQWVQTPKSCLRILQSQILCQLDAKGKPTGNYVWTFRIQNLSGMPVSHLFLANIAPAVATPDHIIFSPALGNNGISTSQQVVLSGVMPGPLTFTMSLHDERLDECCSIPVTLDLPSCDCGQIVREVTPRCFTFPFTSIPPPYRYTFQVQNLAPFAVENLLIAPVDPSDLVTPIPPSQLSVTKDVIPIAAIPQGGTSGPQTLALNGPLAKGGQKVCLRIGLHEKDLDPCCSIVRCFTLPSCFIDFSDVRPIGEARLTFREASFTIDAIGSSGKDGARIAAAGAKSVALAWEPLDSAGPLAPGAYVELRAVSGGDETAGTLRVAKRGDGAYEAVAKIDAAQTYRIEV